MSLGHFHPVQDIDQKEVDALAFVLLSNKLVMYLSNT